MAIVQIPWDPQAQTVTRRHEQLVSLIFNSLLRQGYITQVGNEWIIDPSLFSSSGAFGSGSGIAGQRGADGNAWLAGSTAPLTSQGSLRDFYFNTTTGDVSQKRQLLPFGPAVWVKVANLLGGPPGKDGSNGVDGRLGPTGPPGATGPQGPAGSAGGGAYSLLDSSTLGADTATVTFSSISASYRHLKLTVMGRTAGSVASANVLTRFNSDSGSNYDYQSLQATGTSTSVSTVTGQTAFPIGDVTGATETTAGYCGALEYTFLGYAQTTFFKSLIVNGHVWSAAMFNERGTGQWKSTTAINRIDLTINGGHNWLAGSTFALYGIS